MIMFYAPCKNKKEARSIAKALLEKKLIACANIFPSESIYEWEGKLRQEKESILIIKTLNRQESEVKKTIKQLHSYDTPAIIKLTGVVNQKYLSWMEKTIK